MQNGAYCVNQIAKMSGLYYRYQERSVKLCSRPGLNRRKTRKKEKCKMLSRAVPGRLKTGISFAISTAKEERGVWQKPAVTGRVKTVTGEE